MEPTGPGAWPAQREAEGGHRYKLVRTRLTSCPLCSGAGLGGVDQKPGALSFLSVFISCGLQVAETDGPDAFSSPHNPPPPWTWPQARSRPGSWQSASTGHPPGPSDGLRAGDMAQTAAVGRQSHPFQSRVRGDTIFLLLDVNGALSPSDCSQVFGGCEGPFG